jgi:hypothetical protein
MVKIQKAFWVFNSLSAAFVLCQIIFQRKKKQNWKSFRSSLLIHFEQDDWLLSVKLHDFRNFDFNKFVKKLVRMFAVATVALFRRSVYWAYQNRVRQIRRSVSLRDIQNQNQFKFDRAFVFCCKLIFRTRRLHHPLPVDLFSPFKNLYLQVYYQ